MKLTLGIAARSVIVLGLAAGLVSPFASPLGGSDDPPLFLGYMGQFTLVQPLRPAPLTPMLAADGERLDLTRFRGRVVLLNFWATWCAPCIREMPTLLALQDAFAGEAFAMVALSVDRKEWQVIKPFLKQHRLERLGVYVDVDRKAFKAFAVRGLPVTYLIDHEGRYVGYLEGPAEWDSDEAKALIRYYVERAAGAAGRG